MLLVFLNGYLVLGFSWLPPCVTWSYLHYLGFAGQGCSKYAVCLPGSVVCRHAARHKNPNSVVGYLYVLQGR
ncbi:hypothetical protein F5Y14DRAFT_415524 [Nemania sp. NC0429]|nr:hypothetical protein F5Y14DRAFT_415524 [Nemania sp. NC0429]